MLLRKVLLLLVLVSIPAAPASAVLLSAGDGTGNTSAPPDDPGWDHVGTRGNLSAIYLGNRWVLTANHAGFGEVAFAGAPYQPVDGSNVRLKNPDTTNADLRMFKLLGTPPLLGLSVASSAPPVGSQVTLIGHGRNRGAAQVFMGIPGWLWAAGYTMRWGTNEIDRFDDVLGTAAIVTVFDQFGLAHESQGIVGDSGGAMFYDSGAGWELIGTIYAQGTLGGQPGTVFGNESYAADLSLYRAQIVALTSVPSCSDGLDDDDDGFTDFPEDPGCASALDPSEEFAKVPALGGSGLALLVGSFLLLAGLQPWAAETSSR